VFDFSSELKHSKEIYMSDEETKILPNEQGNAPTTQPMLEAILAQVKEGFAEVNSKLGALSAELAAFRLETDKNFRTVNNKFSVLTDKY
jgi:hypothetical protein